MPVRLDHRQPDDAVLQDPRILGAALRAMVQLLNIERQQHGRPAVTAAQFVALVKQLARRQ